MEGSGRSRRPTLALQREFAGSRLEEQVLRRAFELVVPGRRRAVPVNQRSATEADNSPGPLLPTGTQGG
jgi:hypothetical protein